MDYREEYKNWCTDAYFDEDTKAELKALEGNAVLTITEEEGGTYTITASLKGADAEETYTFTWNSGETGAVLTGVPAEELAGRVGTGSG